MQNEEIKVIIANCETVLNDCKALIELCQEATKALEAKNIEKANKLIKEFNNYGK